MRKTYRNSRSTKGNMLANILAVLMISGPCLGYIILSQTIPAYVDACQMQPQAGLTGLTPPYDRPLLEGDELFLTEETRQNWDKGQLLIANGGSLLVAGSEKPVTLRIHFKNWGESLEGNWRGKTAALFLTGSLVMDIPGTPGNRDADWGGSLGNKYDAFSPWFEVRLPLDEVDLSLPWEQRLLQGRAVVNYEVPGMTGNASFEDFDGTMEARFELVVLTPQEVAAYLQVREGVCASASSGRTNGVLLAILVAAVLIIVPLVVMRKRFGP